jgi:hypothetical protein
MGLPAMNLLIRLTKRTYTVFNRFDKPESHPLLLSSGMATDRAAFADLRHASVLSVIRSASMHALSLTLADSEDIRKWHKTYPFTSF